MNVRIEEGWKQALASEWEAPYFEQLTGFVSERYRQATIYPPGNRIFAAFDACPFDKVKVVILGQDPYHGPGQANGLCFSVNPGIAMPPSLINIFKEIHDAFVGRPRPMGRTGCAAAQRHADRRGPSGRITPGEGMGNVHRPCHRGAVAQP